MRNEFVDRIGVVVLSKVLAHMVIQQAASRHPEIIESRDQGGARFLFFVKAAGDKVDEAITNLRRVTDRLGHLDTQENMSEFRTAIDKEVKIMVDAGMAAFNNTPQHPQVEPRPG